MYDAICQPRGSEAIERSLKLGFLYEFHDEYISKDISMDGLLAGNATELAKLGKEIEAVYDFHWAEMPEADWVRAKAMLEAKLRP